MKIPFTKMHGAGNDFVVIDETQRRWSLGSAHYRAIAARHTGVGADQILTVRPSPTPGIDFEYLIHNADGGQVQQCGNGARCFARYVHAKGLTTKSTIAVQTMSGVIYPELLDAGRVRVDMGQPVLECARVPFVGNDVWSRTVAQATLWTLPMPQPSASNEVQEAECVVLSMGNPHAVFFVDDVQTAPVSLWGAHLQNHAAFPERVNVGFLQMCSRTQAKLRVFERGVGETLACGTGACAAAVAAMLRGLADTTLDIQTAGGVLSIAWNGNASDSVYLSGPTAIVYEGEIELADNPSDAIVA